MAQTGTRSDRYLRLAGTLLAGALGGAVFAWLNTPLPWMLGALFVTTCLALAGTPLELPQQLRRIMITVLGVMLGSAFHADIFDHVVRWFATLAGMVTYIVVSAGLAMWFFQRIGRLDPVTSFFAAAPGGLSEMAVLGPMMGGDERQITLVHATRIVMVMMIIPPAFRIFGGYVPPANLGATAGLLDIDPVDLGMLALAAVGGFVVARALRFPAYQMTGPMLASAAIHIAGVTTARPPFELIAAAQVIIGCGAGVRFAGVSFRELTRPVTLSLISTSGLLISATLFALLMSAITGIDFRAIILAYGPGGFAEMTLIALSLGIEVPFVAVHHVGRIFLVVMLASWLSHLIWRRRLPAASGAGNPAPSRKSPPESSN